MKTLLLLRHAKSGEDGFAARDYDRRLNGKGRRAAGVIGGYLRDQGLAFDRVLASPAVRVRETIAAVAEGYGQPISPDFVQTLYLASVDDLIEAIGDVSDAIECVLLVGHNPGLERLVLHLVPPEAGQEPRDAVATKYPTASLAEIALDIVRWGDLRGGTGRLIRFVRPRDLDPALGPDEG